MVRIQNKLGILEYHCMVLSRKNTLSQKRGRSFLRYSFLKYLLLPTLIWQRNKSFQKSPAKNISTLFTKKFKFMQYNLIKEPYFQNDISILHSRKTHQLITNLFSSQKRRSHHIKPYFKITLSKSHQ